METPINYLRRIVNEVCYDADAFKIYCGSNRYIMGFGSKTMEKTNKFFMIKTVYDTIIDIDCKIKYSFEKAIDFDLNQSLEDYNPFEKQSHNEYWSMYYVENIIFRTSTLWDLLAQLYNIYYDLGYEIDEIYYRTLFNNCAQGKKAIEQAKQIDSYFRETDDMDTTPWHGNHDYVAEFRNQMAHRNSPCISTISDFAQELRPPAIYVLNRVIEDYVQVSKFIDEFLSAIDFEDLLSEMTAE